MKFLRAQFRIATPQILGGHELPNKSSCGDGELTEVQDLLYGEELHKGQKKVDRDPLPLLHFARPGDAPCE